jgi:hypothetical protein
MVLRFSGLNKPTVLSFIVGSLLVGMGDGETKRDEQKEP